MSIGQTTREVYRTGFEPTELADMLFADLSAPFTQDEAKLHMGSGRVTGPDDPKDPK